MVKQAEELAKKHGWFLPQQFENPSNPEYHRNTTGPEILRDFAGKRLDYFVSGSGTGGTITGAGEIAEGGPARHQDRLHRARRRADGVGRQVGAAQDPGLDDRLRPGRPQHEDLRRGRPRDGRGVARRRAGPRAEGRDLLRHLLRRDVRGRGKVAEKAPKGSVLLAMLPDTGERYLSTILFEGITEDSDALPA